MRLAYSIATEGVNSGYSIMAAAGYFGGMTIIYTSSGGLIINGNAVYHPIRSFAFEGFGPIQFNSGALTQPVKVFSYSGVGLFTTGGSSEYLKIKTAAPQFDGVLLRGSSSYAKFKTVQGTGGAVFAGAGTISRSIVPTTLTNVIVFGGSSVDLIVRTPRIGLDGFEFSGESQRVRVKAPVGLGGMVFRGSSSDSKQKLYVGLGGFTCIDSGKWSVTKDYQTIQSTILFNGDAILRKIKTLRPIGGIAFLGQWTGAKIKCTSGDGTFSISGTSYNVKLKHYPDPSGGVEFSSTGTNYSKNTIWVYYLTPNGLTLLGDGPSSRTKTFLGAGIVQFSGQSDIRKIKELPASIVPVTFSGTSVVSKIKQILSTAPITLEGGGGISKIKNIIGTLDITLSGGSTLQYIKTYEATSVFTLAGDGEILKIKVIDGYGGLQTGGSSTYRNQPLRSIIYQNHGISQPSIFHKNITQSKPGSISTTTGTVASHLQVTSKGESKISKTPDGDRTLFISGSGKQIIGKQPIPTSAPQKPNNVASTKPYTNTVNLTKGSNKVKI